MNRSRLAFLAATILTLAACGGGGSSPFAPSGGTQALRHASLKPAASGNVILNGNFATGTLADWTQCGTVNAVISTSAYSGDSYSARMGTTEKPEINGDSAICQSVVVPTAGTLTFELRPATDDTIAHAWQTAQLLNASGTVLKTFYQTATTSSTWEAENYSLSAYAGQTVTVKFDVHGTGGSTYYVDQYVDNVSLAGSGSSSPTPSPTASPTTKPSASPTVKPSATPTSAPTPTPSPSSSPYGTPIQHVIVVLQENRTFDNMFHGYPGANYATTGTTSTGATVTLQAVPLMTAWDPSHEYANWVTEYNSGGMNGFNKETLDYGSGAPTNFAYSYSQQSDVQPYWNLAANGVLGDEMFADHRSQSFAGHLFPIAGASGPIDAADPDWYAANNPSGGESCASPGTGTAINISTGATNKTYTSCFDFQTIADLLDAKKVSWKYYVDAADKTNYVSAFSVIKHIYNSTDFTNNVITPETAILSDAANGTLPAVSYVIGTFANSDHAGQTVPSSNGPTWVTSVFNAIGNSKYWNSSVIILVYDDWGGWYDHVAPPTTFNAFEPGFRIPLVINSPYAKKGYISHNVHYMGSVLHFIESTFGLGSLGTSDARSDNFSDCFNFAQAPLPYARVRPPGRIERLFDADLPGYGRTPQKPEDRD